MPGTKKLQQRYGEKLVCVRYLYDQATKKRFKTIELIVEETPWQGKPRRRRINDYDMVAIRVAWEETETRAAIKAAGAIWRPRHRLWEVDWKTVRELKLQDKVVPQMNGSPTAVEKI
ncbi:MAG: hypothetical protein ACKVQK_22165 [Burkholderiales bacterium]